MNLTFKKLGMPYLSHDLPPRFRNKLLGTNIIPKSTQNKNNIPGGEVTKEASVSISFNIEFCTVGANVPVELVAWTSASRMMVLFVSHLCTELVISYDMAIYICIYVCIYIHICIYLYIFHENPCISFEQVL